MAKIYCDSSSLISMADSCLTDILYFFHDKFKVEFIAPPSIQDESVINPVKKGIKEYYLSALKIEKLIDDGILKITKQEKKETEKLLNIANHLFFVEWRPLHLVHYGEIEMLASAKKENEHMLLMDERTTRMLIESPIVLKEHMEKEFDTNIMVERNNMILFSNYVKDMEVIRSSELAILAFENGYFNRFGKKKIRIIEAVLYSLKYSGCAIHMDEIREYINSISNAKS